MAHGLNDEGDGAFHRVGISDGEGHALAFLAYAYDNKMPGSAAAGDEWSFYDEFIDFLAELLLADYLEHFIV